MTDSLKYLVDAVRRAPDELIVELLRRSFTGSGGTRATRGASRAPGAPGGIFLFNEDEYALSYEPPGGEPEPFKVASSNRLLRELARARVEDAARGATRSGWRTTDELGAALGTKRAHMNVLVHRARTALRNAGAGDVIERHPPTRSLRIAVEPDQLRGLD